MPPCINPFRSQKPGCHLVSQGPGGAGCRHCQAAGPLILMRRSSARRPSGGALGGITSAIPAAVQSRGPPEAGGPGSPIPRPGGGWLPETGGPGLPPPSPAAACVEANGRGLPASLALRPIAAAFQHHPRHRRRGWLRGGSRLQLAGVSCAVACPRFRRRALNQAGFIG